MIVLFGVVAFAVVITLVAMPMLKSKRKKNVVQTDRLKAGFGPEYARAVDQQGRSGAEQDLVKREQRSELLHVRPLSPHEVAGYRASWTEAQAHFVDEPEATLTAADRLVTEVIAARGYPVAEFEEGASAVSVDHPRAVQDYRAAHEVVLRNQRNPATVDELRAALVQLRSVFSELLGDSSGSAVPVALA